VCVRVCGLPLDNEQDAGPPCGARLWVYDTIIRQCVHKNSTSTRYSARPDTGRALSRACGGLGYFLLLPPSSLDSTAMKASCGTSTLPTIFIRFLPSFCFSSSFRLREMSPP
jgi:hypothetical protein